MIKIADVSFGTLLRETFNEYGKDFMLYFQNLLLIYVIPSTILAFLFNLGYSILQVGNYLNDFTKYSISNTASIGIFVLVGFIYFIYIILTALLGSLFTSSLFRIKKLKDNNMNLDSKTVFRDAKKYILPNIGLGILQFLAYLGIFVLIGIPTGLIYLGTKNNILTVVAGVISSIIGMIFILKLVIEWSFSSPRLIYDGKKIVESLKFSKKLVKGDWWSIFGKVMLMGLIVGGLTSALILPLMLLTFLLSLIPVIGGAIQSGISAAITAAITPLGIIFITKLYKRTKENKQIR